MWLISRFYSRIEKLMVKSPCSRIKRVIDRHSLEVFKKVRLILFVIGSLEQAGNAHVPQSIIITGVVLFIIGAALRCLAIWSLGSFWSFNVVIYEDQVITRRGVYRFLRHPAYIGNVYIAGLLLCFGAPITALTALLGAVVFYVYRARIEERAMCSL
jgi:protein-S-isoprenylcysteine O-methyltransferase Ste14